jgi:hypothetical protein
MSYAAKGGGERKPKGGAPLPAQVWKAREKHLHKQRQRNASTEKPGSSTRKAP